MLIHDLFVIDHRSHQSTGRLFNFRLTNSVVTDRLDLHADIDHLGVYPRV